ncbi:hypothetical protein GCM10010103_53420 [Streptomyces paradoxus]
MPRIFASTMGAGVFSGATRVTVSVVAGAGAGDQGGPVPRLRRAPRARPGQGSGASGMPALGTPAGTGPGPRETPPTRATALFHPAG